MRGGGFRFGGLGFRVEDLGLKLRVEVWEGWKIQPGVSK